jgi:AcrR family transcriptional regulator
MKPAQEVDPRIKRTRQMLFEALIALLVEKNFESITVQDIADRSTVNRGTIYAHFKDKFALLEAMIQEDFGRLFEARMAGASGTCSGGVKQLILAVCDYLGRLMSCSEKHQRPFEPVVESTVRGIVRDFLLAELNRSDKVASSCEAQLRATVASWAICGTVLEWSRTRSIPPEELADAVLPLVATGLFLPVESVCSQSA